MSSVTINQSEKNFIGTSQGPFNRGQSPALPTKKMNSNSVQAQIAGLQATPSISPTSGIVQSE